MMSTSMLMSLQVTLPPLSAGMEFTSTDAPEHQMPSLFVCFCDSPHMSNPLVFGRCSFQIQTWMRSELPAQPTVLRRLGNCLRLLCGDMHATSQHFRPVLVIPLAVDCEAEREADLLLQ